MPNRTWIYHKTEEPKIITKDKYDEYYAEGWRDSPAPFINIKDFDIDADDQAAVQNLGDTVQGVADALNGALNIDEMEKDDLEEYAQEHFGRDIDKRKGIEKLRLEVQGMIDGKDDAIDAESEKVTH